MNKTKRTILTIIGLLSVLFIFAQENNKHHTRNYIKYSEYKDRYSSKDSLGFLIKDNDTLIRVENFIKPKGKSVPYEPKDSIFLELYKSIAFRPLKNDLNKSRPMKYWKNDIKIFYSKSVSRKVIREVMSFTKELDKSIDSLNISKVSTKEKANFIIYHDSDFEFDPNLKNNFSSNYWVYWNKKNQLNKGFIRVSKQRLFSDKLEIVKIKELFISSLGWFLMNDKYFDCGSYFSGCYTNDEKLLATDLALLKYHYSYGICKGTDRTTFEEQHKQAKEILKTSNSKLQFYHNN